jgi:hypothetical protein
MMVVVLTMGGGCVSKIINECGILGADANIGGYSEYSNTVLVARLTREHVVSITCGLGGARCMTDE